MRALIVLVLAVVPGGAFAQTGPSLLDTLAPVPSAATAAPPAPAAGQPAPGAAPSTANAGQPTPPAAAAPNPAARPRTQAAPGRRQSGPTAAAPTAASTAEQDAARTAGIEKDATKARADMDRRMQERDRKLNRSMQSICRGC